MPLSECFTRMIGRYHARIATLFLSREHVLQMLPCGVELADSMSLPGHGDRHPVFFGFGHHRDVTMTHFEWVPIFPMEYLETFVGVPGLRHTGWGPYSGPFHYVARLFLDRFLPTLGGNLIWGFTKRLATLGLDDRGPEATYTVRSLWRRRPLYVLRAEPHGVFQPPSAYPNFGQQGAGLDERLIEQLFFQLGPLASSTFRWDWAAAEVRPLQTEVRLQTSFLPGIHPGIHDSPGIDAVPYGSFEMRVSWSLSLPFWTGAPG
jgi:hypothetical protein